MTRRRNHSSSPVSLFPFLAVLVCAMGGLIFLLLVTTRRVRDDARARANQAAPAQEEASKQPTDPPQPPDFPSEHDPAALASSAAPPVPPVDDRRKEKIKTVEQAVARLQDERTGHLRRINARRDELIEARNRIDDLQAQIERTRKKLQELEREKPEETETRQELEQQQEVLKDRITQLREEIDKARREQQAAASKYAVVPFEGRTGTVRRPILIECTRKGLRFLPEDVVLTKADLEGFVPGYNPLLAGAQALLGYWRSENRRNGSGPDADPYVLLLVRPSGSIAYYVARRFLDKLGGEFGYEMIPKDWELELPEADPQARSVLKNTVKELLTKRRSVAQSVVDGWRTGGDKRIRFRRGPYGLEVVENDSGPGGTDAGDGFGSGRRSGGFGGGRDRGDFNTGSGRFGRRGEKGAKQGKTSEDGRSFGDGTGADSPTGGNGEKSGRAGRPSKPVRPRVINIPQDGQTSSSNEKGLITPGDNRGDGQTRGEPQAGRSSGDEDGAGRSGGRGRGAGGEKRGKSKSGGRRGEGDRRATDTGSSGRWTSDRKGDGFTGRHIPFPSNRRKGESASGGRSSTGGRSSGGGRYPPEVRMPAGGTSGSASGSGSRSGSASGSSRPSRSARAGGRRRWGHSGSRAGIGLERNVTIRVQADRIIIGGEHDVPVGKGETRDELVERVLHALDKHARSWGEPPRSFYWVPALRFVVSPGGNQYYERLRGPLDRLGLSSTVKHTLETRERGSEDWQGASEGSSLFPGFRGQSTDRTGG